MQRFTRGWSFGLATLAMLMSASPALAVDLSGGSYPVSATVPTGLTFNVTVVQLIPAVGAGTTLGSTVTTMNFGNLASNGTFDPDGTGPLPPQPRALNSTNAFQAFFGLNAQQRPFTIKQSASPLQSGINVIPAGAFVVTPLQGVGGDTTKPLPSGITVAARTSAIGTGVVLFSRAVAGPSDTMASTYGITDTGVNNQTIPLDQPAGSYATTVTFTATVI